MELEPGDVVRVRTRLHVVEDMEKPTDRSLGTWVRLACIDDDAQGFQSQVLWESELDAQFIRADDWSHIAQRGFDDPRRFAAFLHAQRWNCVTATDPRLFQAPFRAGIDIKTFQLEPLRKALALPRVNLFIADDVGLGKTIEAGLILRELLIRQKVHKVVVACPPSVVLQWRDELDQRFGLAFEVYNRDFVSRRRRDRGYQINPWTTHSRFIISHALLRDEDYAGSMRDWLGDFTAGSMLILDECHNAAPASGSMYAVDSNLTRQVRGLVERFEHRLFLSATPHNGHSNSFTALLELLDPQRFTRGVPISSTKELEPVMVRRLRSELRAVKGLEADFPRREVIAVCVDGLPPDAPELVLFDLLEEYRCLREEKLKSGAKSALNASMLVMTSLQKRLLSSAKAFARTLKVHRRTVEKENACVAQAPLGPVQMRMLLRAPGPDDSDVEVHDDEAAQAHDRAVEVASALDAAPLDQREKVLLDKMEDVAAGAAFKSDARVQKLVTWVRQNLLTHGQWNSKRVLIFTEYLDSQSYLQECLLRELEDTDRVEDRIASYTGGPPEGGRDGGREAIKVAFNTDPEKHPLRILIATDAAREGVNLQNYCADLFHFDIPWNPGRLEQRNGRIDRTLQRSPVVKCHYFIHPQRPADRVLQVLVEKVRIIRDELGSLSSVLDARVERALESGLWRGNLDAHQDFLVQEAIPREKKELVLKELEDRTEKLEGQLQRLKEIQQVSAEAVGFKVLPFQDAINVALDMAGASPLKAAKHSAKELEHGTWEFPRLDTSDSSWVTSMDALRAPRPPDQKLWDWRRELPIRPITFKDPGQIDNTTVHLHLEHRLVRRLLGRLLAQGFVRHDMARACVVRAESSIARVVVLGRLSLYGRGASRLHEEIIPVTARWLEPSQRKDGLKAFAADGKRDGETLTLLEDALLHAESRPVKSAVREMLRAEAARDVEQLLTVLKARAQEAAADAENKLQKRAEKEGQDMAKLLDARKARLEQAVREHDGEQGQQLRLKLSMEEQRQQAADRAAWADRLKRLTEEIPREPKRVRATYDVTLTRVEPLGLIYLWPEG